MTAEAFKESNVEGHSRRCFDLKCVSDKRTIFIENPITTVIPKSHLASHDTATRMESWWERERLFKDLTNRLLLQPKLNLTLMRKELESPTFIGSNSIFNSHLGSPIGVSEVGSLLINLS